MTKTKSFGLAAVVAALGFSAACNSDYTPVEITYTSVAVTSFSIAKDDSILAGLDTVFFSIDLQRAQIFNADSLPFGTRTDKLVPKMTTLEGASEARFIMTRPGKPDSISDYLTNPNDSIDFSNGPVSLFMKSPDGKVERTYTVKVNVHRQKADSLAWGRVAYRDLPGDFAIPQRQHTTATADAVYCLTADAAGAFCIATAADPSADEWHTVNPAFGFTPDVDSFTAAADGTLYILSTAGQLYSSADSGSAWTECAGIAMRHIYGAYADGIVGACDDNGSWRFKSYPASVDIAIPADMPVSGTSPAVNFSFPMSQSEQMVFIGGRKAFGGLTNTAWGFDGRNLMPLSAISPIPALEGMVLFPYFTFRTSALWVTTKYTTLFALGGKDAGGIANRNVYISTDYGVTWRKGDSLLQLPSYIPTSVRAQAVVFPVRYPLSRSGASLWKEMPVEELRVPAALMSPGISTMATRPVEDWDCPFIYLFGGEKAGGLCHDTVWRGVINRMTYKPIQ